MTFRSRFLAACATLSLFGGHALAKEGPGGVAPIDDQPQGAQPVPAVALDPITADQYASSPNLVVAIFGGKAKKIYAYYGDLRPFDFNRPFAPLYRYEVKRFEGQLKCIRREAHYQEERFRCNFLFHPGAGQTSVTVGDKTYTLEPTFNEKGLDHIRMIQSEPGANGTFTRTLLDEVCPRYGTPSISQGPLSCAYFYDTDDFDAFYNPEDINPQGVAVGWGVVQPPSTESDKAN